MGMSMMSGLVRRRYPWEDDTILGLWGDLPHSLGAKQPASKSPHSPSKSAVWRVCRVICPCHECKARAGKIDGLPDLPAFIWAKKVQMATIPGGREM